MTRYIQGQVFDPFAGKEDAHVASPLRNVRIFAGDERMAKQVGYAVIGLGDIARKAVYPPSLTPARILDWWRAFPVIGPKRTGGRFLGSRRRSGLTRPREKSTQTAL